MADADKKKTVWDYVLKSYNEKDVTVFKLSEMTEQFSAITQIQLQTICDEFIVENKFLPPERSRVVSYKLNTLLLPTKVVVNKENNSSNFRKIVEKPIVNFNNQLLSSKPKPLSDISVNVMASEISMAFNKSNNLCNSSTNIDKNPKVLSISRDNKVVSDEIISVVMKEILIDVSNPDADIGYISQIKPRCLSMGLSSDQFDKAMDFLMQENRLFINQDEIFIM